MYTSHFSLQDKVALITGGSRGIGRAIALAFAEAGADVVVASRKISDLETVAEEIRKLGRRSLAVASHVSKIEDLDNLVKRTMDEFDTIDILVNNAGINPAWGYVLDDIYDEPLWNKIMDVNLKGPFFLSRLVAKVMKERGGGTIINIATMEALKPGEMTPVYDISKAGLIHFTKIAAKEWASYNIRVNAIAPGLVQTRLSSPLWERGPEFLNEILSTIPLRRAGQPEDIVHAALYFASDASSYATGAILVIDGGCTL